MTDAIMTRYFEARISFEEASEELNAAWQATAKTKEYKRYSKHVGQKPKAGPPLKMWELYHDFLRERLEATREYKDWKELESDYDVANREMTEAGSLAWAALEDGGTK